jgi:hypothetical protein
MVRLGNIQRTMLIWHSPVKMKVRYYIPVLLVLVLVQVLEHQSVLQQNPVEEGPAWWERSENRAKNVMSRGAVGEKVCPVGADRPVSNRQGGRAEQETFWKGTWGGLSVAYFG